MEITRLLVMNRVSASTNRPQDRFANRSLHYEATVTGDSGVPPTYAMRVVFALFCCEVPEGSGVPVDTAFKHVRVRAISELTRTSPGHGDLEHLLALRTVLGVTVSNYQCIHCLVLVQPTSGAHDRYECRNELGSRTSSKN